jgi:uncharacterized protein YycO
MKNKVVNRIKITGIAVAIVIMAAVVIIMFLEKNIEKNGHYVPDYAKQDLKIIAENGIQDGEYKEIFLQTGLGRAAVDNLIANDSNYVDELKNFQRIFYAENEYVCNRITVITGEEQSVYNEDEMEDEFKIQGLEDGDVLIALSTHSLGWRHGHAAVVTDAEKGITLESLVLGQDSIYQYYKKWEKYPTFIQLRIRDEALKQIGMDRNDAEKKLKEIAENKLSGVPYGLFAGIPVKYNKNIHKTHCAHLVWYTYKELGIDIDSDHGFFVTPNDISNSDLLEIVQIYGVNPMDYIGDYMGDLN